MRIVPFVLVATVVCPAGNAHAQQPSPSPPTVVEQVVVEADRAQDRRDPVSFTDVSKAQIQAAHRGQDLASLLADVPGAYAYSDAGNNVGYAYLSLRGFDQRRIAVNIDGVPLNTAETHQVYFVDLADFASSLEGVQIQRGTGTALYGSPAVGGVVNLETAMARTLVGNELSLTGGSFDTWRGSARHAGQSAGGRWAWLGRIGRVSSGGYRDRSGARHLLGQLSVERYGERSVLRLGAFGGPERTELAFAGVTREFLRGEITGNADADRRANFLHPGEIDTYTQPHLRLIHDLALRPTLSLRNTIYAVLGSGAFRQFDASRDVAFSFDDAGRPLDVQTVDAAWRRRGIDERRLGFIPRARFVHGRGTLDAGFEAGLHRARHRGRLTDGAIGGTALSTALSLYDYRTEKDSFSAFARETVAVTPELSVNAEIQATTHRYAMGSDATRGFSYGGRYAFVTPRVGVNWNPTSRLGLYAAVSTARSEPAFRDLWDSQDVAVDPRRRFASVSSDGHRLEEPLARPEKLVDVELGAGIAVGRGKLRLGAYRMIFRDELVFSGGIDDDGNPLTTNAGRSIHEGLELQGSGPIVAGIEADGFVSASHDRLSSLALVGVSESAGPLLVDYSDNRIALFPSHIARLRLSRPFGSLRLSLGARHVGRIYLDNSENERKTPGVRRAEGYVDKFVDPGWTLDAQATLVVSDRLKLQAFAENLANRRYSAFGYSYPTSDYSSFYSEFFPAATRGVYFGATWTF